MNPYDCSHWCWCCCCCSCHLLLLSLSTTRIFDRASPCISSKGNFVGFNQFKTKINKFKMRHMHTNFQRTVEWTRWKRGEQAKSELQENRGHYKVKQYTLHCIAKTKPNRKKNLEMCPSTLTDDWMMRVRENAQSWCSLELSETAISIFGLCL